MSEKKDSEKLRALPRSHSKWIAVWMKFDIGLSIPDFLPVSQDSLFGDMAAPFSHPAFPNSVAVHLCTAAGNMARTSQPRSEWACVVKEGGRGRGWALPGLQRKVRTSVLRGPLQEAGGLQQQRAPGEHRDKNSVRVWAETPRVNQFKYLDHSGRSHLLMAGRRGWGKKRSLVPDR